MHHPPTAYPVPFSVDRTHAPRRYDLVNTGDEPLDGLTLTHLGDGYCPPLAVRRLEPGRALSIAVFGADPERTGVVVVRWRRPDRSEYLWRMSLVGGGPVA
ncbi:MULTISPECIES: hypothetical protein [unclassified Curtobacterium]|uniref:hypothetical protein n=1 Tax=unclassified Curtobacterium TaxID=257496 RepID=UPI0008DD4F8E|nr:MULTISPECIES: hypothetical protein [unclassified Curtobacterium]OIH96838.1 hypothetical protein BIU92_03730 [Curtobacterium sp. MCBA15_003]OII09337.1 hypothetical protein BIU97_12460 [Curtobacterium sp. MCBA15_009]OII29099.1 hypothetical protein BIU94_13440 [Curtobacterium sp. MMLR14_006]WIE65852.1 hypothetical protein DEI99_004750 [Curtobacterium sp. MCLR17_036]